MSHRIIPSGFVKSVLQNGVGRHICQLQRLTLKFCKSHVGSKGMRDYIENSLLDFTRKNPGVVVYLQPRRHRTPRLVAEYLNGEVHQHYVNNYTEEEIHEWIELLHAQSGQRAVRLRKHWHTDSPSIQGVWTPMTNRQTEWNIKTFPDKGISEKLPNEPTATEILMQKAAELRAKSSNS